MIRLSSHIQIHYLLLFLIFFPNTVRGQDQSEFTSTSIHGILHFLEKSHQDAAALSQTKKLLAVQYDSLVYAIDRIKLTGEIGFFDRFELKSLLKESEDISKQFVKIDNLLKAHEDANRLQVAKLVSLMDREVLDAIGVLLTRKSHNSDLADDVLKLNKMFLEKDRYRVYWMEKFFLPFIDVKTQRADDADILYQKADFLMDHIDRLNTYSKELDQIILFINNENTLKNRAENLFRVLHDDGKEMVELQAIFPDSLLALQRLPLSKNLVSPFDDYESLIERLTVEKEAAHSKIRFYRDMSEDIRDIADYKTKVWAK